MIRRAVSEFIRNYADQVIEKADKLQKVQKLEAAVEAIEPYLEK